MTHTLKPDAQADREAVEALITNADAQAGVSSVDDQNWPNSGGHYQVKQADFSAYPNYA